MLEHIDSFLLHVGVEKGLSRATLSAYSLDLAQFARFWIDRKKELEPVTSADLVDFLATLRASGLSRASVARKLSALRCFFAFLASERRIESNPALTLAPPRGGRRLPETLSEEEVEALLSSCSPDSVLGLRNRTLLETLYSCGLRVSEACGLDLFDLDLENSLLKVRGKGCKERLAPFGRVAFDLLSTYLRTGRPELARSQREQALFLNARGGRLSRVGCFGIIRHAARRANIAHRVSPHVLRHSFASHLLNRGADVRFVQELLGHASVSTTVIYTHLQADKLFADYRRFHPRA
jgi:tyrosine recombinase XerD